MTLGGNMDKDVPTKSSTAFSEDKPTQGNAFSKDRQTEDNHVFEGDNTGASAYGGDFGTYGDIYGEGNYGGLTHFLNRPTLPTINH